MRFSPWSLNLSKDSSEIFAKWFWNINIVRSTKWFILDSGQVFASAVPDWSLRIFSRRESSSSDFLILFKYPKWSDWSIFESFEENWRSWVRIEFRICFPEDSAEEVRRSSWRISDKRTFELRISSISDSERFLNCINVSDDDVILLKRGTLSRFTGDSSSSSSGQLSISLIKPPIILERRSRTESRTSNSTRREEKLSECGIERRNLTYRVVHVIRAIFPEALS